jgi:hypothetical protein
MTPRAKNLCISPGLSVLIRGRPWKNNAAYQKTA